MKPSRADGERSLAVFIDFENVGLGFGGRRDRFEIHKVLERIVEKGKIVAKKAYADWNRFAEYTRSLHEAAIELIEIPRRAQTGKNSADIRLVVDAIDLAYSKDHIDTFVIVSGDSDFSPLVSKLKELGKHVIGIGLADATSVLLRDNCDEFIYYEDLGRAAPAMAMLPQSGGEDIPENKRKVFALILETLLALRRENKEVIYSSMLKDTIKRKKPSFNEGYYGYRTFSELLEDAEQQGVLELEKHKGSGMYVVVRFGAELSGGPPAARERDREPEPANNGGRGRGPVRGRSGPAAPPEPRPMPEARPEPPRPPVEPPRSRVAVEPPRPPAEPPRPRVAAEPPPRPRPAPVAPPAPVAKMDEATPPSGDRPLGRALMDELDEDVDLVPSYRSAAVRPTPAKPPQTKAAAGKPPAAEKPAEPAPRRAARPPAAKADETPTKADAPPPKAPARRASEPRKAAAPLIPKPPADEGDFGAGLDV